MKNYDQTSLNSAVFGLRLLDKSGKSLGVQRVLKEGSIRKSNSIYSLNKDSKAGWNSLLSKLTIVCWYSLLFMLNEKRKFKHTASLELHLYLTFLFLTQSYFEENSEVITKWNKWNMLHFEPVHLVKYQFLSFPWALALLSINLYTFKIYWRRNQHATKRIWEVST